MSQTTTDELESSTTTKIVGTDEAMAADVVQRSDGKKALVVDAAITANNSDQFTNKKYRIEIYNAETAFPASSSYAVLKNWTSFIGVLFGFHLDADSDKVQVKLTIDGEVIFQDIAIKDVKDLGFDKATTLVRLQSNMGFMANATELDFSPHRPMRVASSIKLEVKKSDATAFKIVDYAFFYQKDN